LTFLQEWNFIKRAERWFKRTFMFQDARGMSVMPPDAYAARFNERVVTAIIEHDNPKSAVAAPFRSDRRMSVAPARLARGASGGSTAGFPPTIPGPGATASRRGGM